MSTLELQGLSVRFATPDGEVRAVESLDLAIEPGEVLGIVGESGSGKSQTFLAVMGLLARNGRTDGRALFRGRDLLSMGSEELNKIRGSGLSMVFQDPMTCLNPYLTVGRQLTEVLELHQGMSKAQARDRAIEMLARVQIPDAAKRFGLYPHEFSGGMRQRVMIAMALLCKPELLIADEPTTALDVTVQAQILDLMRDLVRDSGAALVLITHDLAVIAGLATRVAVMYGGRIVELAPVGELFATPRHPYTHGLLASTPRLDQKQRDELPSIPGQPPSPRDLGAGCAFQPRCAVAVERCAGERPLLAGIGPGRRAACHLVAS